MNSYLRIRKEDANGVSSLHITILAILGVFALIIFDITSLFSYGYTMLLLLGSSFYICRNDMKNVLFTYHFLMLFAIAFTLIFKEQSPEYLGMTGHEGGIGTDDCRFYAQIVEGIGIRYQIMVSLSILHPFSVFFKTIYPFTVHTPLNLVLVNLLFGAYLPIFSKKFATAIFENDDIGKTAFWLSLLCPFTLYYSCILVRESLTALLVIAGLYYYTKKQYIALIPCIFILAFIRLGTLSFLLCGIFLLYWMGRNKRSVILFVFLMILIIYTFYLIPGAISGLSGGKLDSNIIRLHFLEGYEDSTISKIMKLPFPLNILLSTLFFLLIPLLNIPKPAEGHYLVSSFFINLFTPFYLFYLWKFLINASLTSISEKKYNIKMIFYLIILFALLLGTISLQFRHKSVLFPIICILAAYGKINYNKNFGAISILFSFGIISIELLLTIMKI